MLLEGETAAFAVLLDGGADAPLNVFRRPLGAAGEINVILDLEFADVVVQQAQFFVDGQAESFRDAAYQPLRGAAYGTEVGGRRVGKKSSHGSGGSSVQIGSLCFWLSC